MKITRSIFVIGLITLIFSSLNSWSQTLGETHENRIEIRDHRNQSVIMTVPLSRGKWIVTQVTNRSIPVGFSSAQMKDVGLALEAGGKLIEVVEITAKVDSVSARWTNEPCIIEPTLYKNNFGTRLWRQKCITIAPSKFLQNNNEATRNYVKILTERNIKFDFNSIAATYTQMDDSHRFLAIRHHFFPSNFDLENPLVNVIAASPWHPSRAIKDGEKTSFISALSNHMVEISKAYDQVFERKIPDVIRNFSWSRLSTNANASEGRPNITASSTADISVTLIPTSPISTPFSSASGSLIAINSSNQSAALLAPQSHAQGSTPTAPVRSGVQDTSAAAIISSDNQSTANLSILNNTSSSNHTVDQSHINSRVISAIEGRATNSVTARVELETLDKSLSLFITLRNHINSTTTGASKERFLQVVDREISRLRTLSIEIQDRFTKKFLTPVQPENKNLGTTAFRAANTFPKIPYYIPGTKEFGEILVVPFVSKEGKLLYRILFIDPTVSSVNTRDEIIIADESISEFIEGLAKIDEWTAVAQKNEIRRMLSKTSMCTPKEKCENKAEGNSSTEVVFQIYEDGSTSGKIQLNKGRFNTTYNFSVESSILLTAYLNYMHSVGKREFTTGSMNDAELKNLFR